MSHRFSLKIPALFFVATIALSVSGLGQAPGGGLSAPTSAGQGADTKKAVEEAVERERQLRMHAKWNVCVDVQMVALEESKALELLPRFQSDDQAEVEEAWVRLQTMIKAREAVLLGWPMVKTMDGSRAVSETAVEKWLSTEFEPPQQPQTFLVGPEPPKPRMNPSVVESTPIAFEMRNLGVTLEIVPTVLSEGKRAYLEFVAARVDLLGWDDYGHVLSRHNTLLTVPQPLFVNLKSNLDLILRNGQRQLVAVHKLTKPEGFIELHLVRAVITKAE